MFFHVGFGGRVARQPDMAAEGTKWFFRSLILTNASVVEPLSRPPRFFPF